MLICISSSQGLAGEAGAVGPAGSRVSISPTNKHNRPYSRSTQYSLVFFFFLVLCGFFRRTLKKCLFSDLLRATEDSLVSVVPLDLLDLLALVVLLVLLVTMVLRYGHKNRHQPTQPCPCIANIRG